MADLLKTTYEKLPSFYTDRLEKEAYYARIDDYEQKFFQIAALTTVLVSVLAFLSNFSPTVKAGIAGVSILIGIPSVPYLYISLKAEGRKDEMENLLPDALRLVSANIKSGHNLEKALLLSARDEFGPLAEEFRETAMDMYGGKPVEEALENMEDRVKSELFGETIKLLVDAMEAGANTAELLENSSNDVRKSIELRDEIKSSIRMYTVFIMMAAVVGAPLLFSISVHMAQETTTMWEEADIGSMEDAGGAGGGGMGGGMGMSMDFSAPDIDIQFFTQFAMMAIVLINFFSALIIAQIGSGNIKKGAKYIPVFVTVALVLFSLVRTAVASLMGSMG
ncbi:MAG: flagellar protein FlaJ [Colwellia polaris]|jgi:flagellar protein FlaJ